MKIRSILAVAASLALTGQIAFAQTAATFAAGQTIQHQAVDADFASKIDFGGLGQILSPVRPSRLQRTRA